MNEAHGSDHPSRHAISVKHHRKPDQRLRPTWPNNSQHISKKLARTQLSATNCKRKHRHTPPRDTTNHPQEAYRPEDMGDSSGKRKQPFPDYRTSTPRRTGSTIALNRTLLGKLHRYTDRSKRDQTLQWIDSITLRRVLRNFRTSRKRPGPRTAE